MSTGTTFGSWLKRRRKEQGIAPDPLAEQIGCSTITLLKIEAGERRPSRQVALLLAQYFSIPEDEYEEFVAFARATPQEGRQTGDLGDDEISLRAPWRAARRHKTNLPYLLTRLVGREREIEEASGLLLQGRVRLLTLTGAPGIGKTRLALQLGSHLLDHFEDGVFLVELATVDDPDIVLTSAARALGLKETADLSAEEALFDYVQKRRMVLILDNFEHLLDAAPSVVRLLEGSPWLKVLATSRESLHVRGERRFPVPPLAIPAIDEEQRTKDGRSFVALQAFPSVELFVERAQAVAFGFALSEGNASDVAAICAGLEGLPLAIELTAARIDQLSLREMRDSLDSRLDLGSDGARDLPPRQRTLLASIEWSYNLLTEEEQALFRRLGVFIGGFTPAAVAALCEPASSDVEAPGVSNTLLSLVNKNLVSLQKRGVRGDADYEDRYRLLETIREYAHYRLIANGEEGATRLLHARYFMVLAEEAFFTDTGPRQAALLDRMDADYSNVLAVLNWLLSSEQSDADSDELAVRTAIGLCPYWDLRGYFTEGRAWGAKALEKGERLLWQRTATDGTPREIDARLLKFKAQLMNGVGLLAWNQGDHDAARGHFDGCLPILHETDNRKAVGRVLNNIAILESEQGKYEKAIELYGQVLEIARELDRPPNVALALNNMGVATLASGNLDKARTLYEESLALYRQTDDQRGTVLALDNLGIVATHDEDYAAARRYHEEALSICRTLGHKNSLAHVLANMASRAIAEGDFAAAREHYREVLPMLQQQGYLQVIVKCLEGLATLSYKEGRAHEAATLWGAAEAMRVAGKHPRAAIDVEPHKRDVATASAQMGMAEFEAACVQGSAMSVQEALTFALNQLQSPSIAL